MNGIENIVANDGVAISITGMSIVFVALVLITVYISLLPKILAVLHRFLPEKETHYTRAEDASAQDDERMVAVAIAAALYRRQQLEKQQSG